MSKQQLRFVPDKVDGWWVAFDMRGGAVAAKFGSAPSRAQLLQIIVSTLSGEGFTTREIADMTDGLSAGRAASMMGDDAMVGVAEIADRAGVKPDTVHAWRARHADFPEPTRELAMGPVWWWNDVAAWIARPRPTGRPRRA